MSPLDPHECDSFALPINGDKWSTETLTKKGMGNINWQKQSQKRYKKTGKILYYLYFL